MSVVMCMYISYNYKTIAHAHHVYSMYIHNTLKPKFVLGMSNHICHYYSEVGNNRDSSDICS